MKSTTLKKATKSEQSAHRWVRSLVKASAVLALVAVGFGCGGSGDQSELASPSEGAGGSTTSDDKTDDLKPGPTESTPCDQGTDIVSAGRVTTSKKYKMVFSFGPTKDLPGSKKSTLYQQADLGCGNTVDDVK